MLHPNSKTAHEALCVRIPDLEQEVIQYYSGTLEGVKCKRLLEMGSETCSEFSYDASLKRDGTTVYFDGSIHGTIHWVCDRCLELVKLDQEEKFELILKPDEAQVRKAEEVILRLDDLQNDFYEGMWLDLADLLEEQLLLSLPTKILCKDGCLGLCISCGINLNQAECNCSQGAQGNPFEVLKQTEPVIDNPQT